MQHRATVHTNVRKCHLLTSDTSFRNSCSKIIGQKIGGINQEIVNLEECRNNQRNSCRHDGHFCTELPPSCHKQLFLCDMLMEGCPEFGKKTGCVMVVLVAQTDKTHRRQCKLSSSKKLTCKWTMFICLRPPPPPRFSFWVVQQLCRFLNLV